MDHTFNNLVLSSLSNSVFNSYPSFIHPRPLPTDLFLFTVTALLAFFPF